MDRCPAEETCVSPRGTGSSASIVGVLLAAGLGTRFNPAGERLKLLEPGANGSPAGVPIVAAAARNLKSHLARLLAVVRPLAAQHQPKLHELLRHEGCELVICTHASEGIGASLACGIRASTAANGWVIALGDMPCINPSTIEAVVNALGSGHDTVAPSYRGQRGHPVGFSARCLSDLLRSEGDRGAHAVLEKFPPHLIDVDDDGILIDIDFR